MSWHFQNVFVGSSQNLEGVKRSLTPQSVKCCCLKSADTSVSSCQQRVRKSSCTVVEIKWECSEVGLDGKQFSF